MLSKTIRVINIIGMSISQTNTSMKHRRKHGIEILNQDKSVNIINMSNISNKYINEALRKSLYQKSPIKITD